MTVRSEAQRKADRRYKERRATNQLNIIFYADDKEDAALYDWLKQQPCMTALIKSLLQAHKEQTQDEKKPA